MTHKPWKPIEHFTAVEAHRILKIALRWTPNEIETLQKIVHTDFENALANIQRSAHIKRMADEIFGQDSEKHDSQLAAPEIIKIRKALLSLLDKEENDDDEEEESSDQHASPELARIGAVIRGAYTNWTHFSNTELLASSIHDFCEE